MILYCQSGDLLRSGADLLICPVNCIPGVMGAGLAKAFASRWPELIRTHREFCNHGLLKPGGVALVKIGPNPATVLFLATKDHWRQPSRREWIEAGLDWLGDWLGSGCPVTWEPGNLTVRSIAVPALGCGLGGLDWEEVRPLIEATANAFPEIEWMVYPPPRTAT